MAIARARRSSPQDDELATFVVEPAEPGVTPFAGLVGPKRAAPSGKSAEAAGLALARMRLAVEGGLLMVLGPEGDPLPPQAFATSAAAYPDARLGLPDGTTIPASRVAAVLRARSLGRLGACERGDGWFLAMLGEGGGPEPASEEELRAEHAVQGEPTIVADAGDTATAAPPDRDEQTALRDDGQAAAAEADVEPAAPQHEHAAVDEAQDEAMPDRAAAAIEPRRALAMPWEKSNSKEPTLRESRPCLDAAENARAAVGDGAEIDAEEEAQADAAGDAGAGDAGGSEADVVQDDRAGTAGDATVAADPRMIALGLNQQALAGEGFHALVVRDVPADARLSAGVYNPAIDGWMLRLQDLGALTILPPPEAAEGFTVTLMGIALRPGNANAVRVLAFLPVSAGTRAVALGLDPQALADEGFEVVVIRDVPEGARLSAGAYDLALEGWVLRPRDLEALTIMPPPEARANFTVTLMGIALRPGDASAVRVLASLPVRVA